MRYYIMVSSGSDTTNHYKLTKWTKLIVRIVRGEANEYTCKSLRGSP